MDIEKRILQSVRPRRNGLLLRRDVRAFGSPSQVSVALNRLCAKGVITRLAPGVYARQSKLAEVGRDALLAVATVETRELRLSVKQRKRSRLTHAARVVKNLAKQAGVEFVPTLADRWASAVTRLAGDDINSDATDDLLVALTRAGKLSPNEMVKLTMEHHRATKHV
ncbi:type IV toxin-antitoxin system AbiEi family antitoxin domain-containing protein [Paraburkholderia sediminicola]|uniref:type IV toxin-antitoxin system AbiEi family antitoxin domain-containing protein n=1 Tax=Paraburkholderia sediminicola TaxID=458836 RepID=UPI0038B88F48